MSRKRSDPIRLRANNVALNQDVELTCDFVGQEPVTYRVSASEEVRRVNRHSSGETHDEEEEDIREDEEDEDTDEDSQETCDRDGTTRSHVNKHSKLHEIPEVAAELHRLPSLTCGLARGTERKPETATETELQIVRDVMGAIKAHRKEGPAPYLDAALAKHAELVPEVAKLREDGWSENPVRTWGQLGYSSEDESDAGFIKSKPLPVAGALVPPIAATMALTFPVSEHHLNEHYWAKHPCYSMALIGKLASAYAWASDLFCTDTNFYKMDPDAETPWHSDSSKKMFEHGSDRFLAVASHLYSLLGGSNRERFCTRFSHKMKEAHDLSACLGIPSIAFPINGRMCIFLFGPHPAASRVKSASRSINSKIEALQALRNLFQAMDHLISGNRSPLPSVFLSPAWPVMAESMAPRQRDLLIHCRLVVAELDDDAAALLTFQHAKRNYGGKLSWSFGNTPHGKKCLREAAEWASTAVPKMSDASASVQFAAQSIIQGAAEGPSPTPSSDDSHASSSEKDSRLSPSATPFISNKGAAPASKAAKSSGKSQVRPASKAAKSSGKSQVRSPGSSDKKGLAAPSPSKNNSRPKAPALDKHAGRSRLLFPPLQFPMPPIGSTYREPPRVVPDIFGTGAQAGSAVKIVSTKRKPSEASEEESGPSKKARRHSSA